MHAVGLAGYRDPWDDPFGMGNIRDWFVLPALGVGLLFGASCDSAADGEPAAAEPDAPHLYFGAGGEAGFRARAERPEFAAVREDILRRASQYLDPEDPAYLDPGNLADDVRGSIRRQWGWPRQVGRILSGHAETLGAAAALTEDAAMRDHGKRLLVAFGETFPLDGEIMADTIALDQGEFARGLAFALAFFGEDLTEEEREAVASVGRAYVERILDEVEVPAWYYPYSNWTGVSVGGAGLLALALEDDFPQAAPGWVERAKSVLTDWLDRSFGRDGEYSEHGYINYGLVNVIPFAEALAARGDDSLLLHPHLERSADWIVHDAVPGGTELEPRGSTGYARPGEVRTFATPWPLLMAREHGDRQALWLWEQTVEAGIDNDFPLVQWPHSRSRGFTPFRIIWAPPEGMEAAPPEPGPAFRFFERRGLAVWRSGFAKDDFFFSIEAGAPFPTTHDQADVGHFNLYADGVPWGTDAGKGGPRKRGDRSQGGAHSIVQVDGKSQAFTGGGTTSGGEVLAVEDTEDYGWFSCDTTEAYNFALRRASDSIDTTKVEQASAIGAERVLRQSVVVKGRGGIGPYVVLLDRLKIDGNPHEFVWQMLTETGIGARSEEGRMSLTFGDARLDLTAFSSAADDAGSWRIEPVSFPVGGKPDEFQRVRYAFDAVDPWIATVLVPGRGPTPTASVSLDLSNGDPTLTVRHATGRTDTIRFAEETVAPEVRIGAEVPSAGD